ncbi:hypothetical protein SAMN02910369_02263 [Lachnospiraceae bacterium NE2001]|nr:hypothetical protein SAMN02910369_02263 [Lachnospiraceae bacterium NE2001]
MPKKTKNEWLRKYSGPYAEYEFASQARMVILEAVPIIEEEANELGIKLRDSITDYVDTTTEQDYGKPTKRVVINLAQLQNRDGDLDKANQLYEVVDECKRFSDDFLNNLEGSKKIFKEFYKLNFINLDMSRDDHSYIQTYYDNPILTATPMLMGCGPLLQKKLGSKEPVDYEKLERDLRKPDGRGFLVPYLNMCKAVNTMHELNYQKEHNDRFGWTPNEKQEYLKQYKTVLKSFIDNFDELSKTVEKNGNLYKMGEHLNNIPEELTNSDRDMTHYVGQMRGQLKAIENGWSLEELPLMGQIGEDLALIDRYVKRAPKQLQKSKDELKGLQNDISDINKGIDELNIELLKLQKISEERTTPKGPNQLSEADRLKLENKEILDWHKEYSKTLKEMENKKTDKSKIDAFKAENAEKLEQYEAFRSLYEEFTLSTQIEAMKKRIKDEQKEIEKKQKAIKNKEAELVECSKAIVESEKARSESYKLRHFAWNKKINNQNDKIEVLNEYKKYISKVKDLKLSYDHLFTETFATENDKPLEDVEKKITTGYDEVVELNEYAKKRTQFDIDIYGPNPKYHDEWESKNVMSRQDFAQFIVPYHDQTMKGLPFNEKEMTYINMAATLDAKDAIREAFKNNPQGALSPEQLAFQNYSNWMEDFSVDDDGPRAGTYQFKGIIQAGRERGLEAMQKYARGDKAPVAEMMQKLMYRTQKNFDQVATIGRNAPHFYNQLNTFTGMLEKDPGLLKEFQKYNAKQPKNVRVDLDKIKKIKTISRLHLESLNDADRYKEFVEQYDKNLENALKDCYGKDERQKAKNSLDNQGQRLKLSALRHDILNTVSNAADKYRNTTKPFIDSANKMNEEALAGNPVLAIHKKFVTDKNNSEMSEFFKSVSTSEGLKEFDAFTDTLIEKYGLDFDVEKGLTMGGKRVGEDPRFDYECQKYMLECEQKKLLKEISSGEYEHKVKSEEVRNELISKYMVNNRQICELERATETGVLMSFYKRDESYSKDNIDKGVAYEKKVKDYIEKMDFSSMNPAEIAEQLKVGKYSLDAVCGDIETIVDNEMYADPKKIQEKHFTSLEQNVSVLSSKKYYKKGSAEFDKLVEELQELWHKHINLEKDFKDMPHHPYDAKAIAEEEKKLLDRMDKYLQRKKDEKEAGKDSKMARSRVDVMQAARNRLATRLEEDLNMADRSEERLKGAEATAELMNKKIEKRKDVAEVTGQEILDSGIEEEVYQRNQFAKNAKEAGPKIINDTEKIDRLYESVKNTLYYQTLKDVFGPKKGDSRIITEKNSNMLKAKLGEGLTPEADKAMNNIMNTRFGKMITTTLLNNMINGKADTSHEGIVKLRDETLRKCFKLAMDDKNPNRKADVKEVLEVGQSLGSPELTKEYLNYEKAQKEAARKAAQKKMEEKMSLKKLEQKNPDQKKLEKKEEIKGPKK